MWLADEKTYSPSDWLVVAMVILSVSYIILRPKFKRRDPLETAKPARFGLSQQRGVERQMEALLVELSNMARQISAQLDTRSGKLEVLIREADEKIAELKNLTGGGQERPAMRLVVPEEEKPPALSEIVEDSRHSEVYRLADEGRTPQQIGQQLGRASGEIELILALRGR